MSILANVLGRFPTGRSHNPLDTAATEAQRLAVPKLLTRSFLMVVATQLAFGLSWSVFLLMPKYFALMLDASPRDIGVLSALTGLTAMIGSPLVGILLDHVGRRTVALFGCALQTAIAFAFCSVDSIGPLLVVLQLAQGVAFSATFNACATMAADKAPPGQLGRAMGIFGAANLITNALATAPAEIIAGTHGWTPVFLSSGAVGLVSVGLALALSDDTRSQPTEPRTVARRLAVLSEPATRRNIFTAVCVGGAFASVFTFHQPYALELGMPDVRDFFIGFTIAAVGVRLGLGGLPDRFGHRRVTVASLFAYAGVVFSAVALGPGMLLPLGLAFGACHGVFYPAHNALTVLSASPRERGMVVSLFNGGFNAGFTFSVVSLGWVAEHAGYPMTFVLGGCLALVGAVVQLTGLSSAPSATAA